MSTLDVYDDMALPVCPWCGEIDSMFECSVLFAICVKCGKKLFIFYSTDGNAFTAKTKNDMIGFLATEVKDEQ